MIRVCCIWHSAACTGRALWSLSRKTGNEKWDMAGWGRGNECIHHPWQAQVRPSDPVFFTFWTHCLAAFPAAGDPASARSTDTGGRSDRQGQKKIQNTTGTVDRFSKSTNKITVVHNMQGVLKRLTSCQEKVPGSISGTNLAWQGSDVLAVADRTGQVQPDTSPLPRIHRRPRFHSPFSHLRLSSHVVPCVFLFIYNLSLLICCFSGVTPPAQRDKGITTDPDSSRRAGRQNTFRRVSGEWCAGRGYRLCLILRSKWCKIW